MFVALSRFTIRNEMTDAVREAFRKRPHVVERAPGFLRMMVMSPVDVPNEIWLVTHWTDESSYHEWHGSRAYRESHVGIPKGLKLVPKSAEAIMFDVFAE